MKTVFSDFSACHEFVVQKYFSLSFLLSQCVCNIYSSVQLYSGSVVFSVVYNNLIVNGLVRIFWL